MYGFSLLSPFTILTVAVLKPATLGSNCILKVVLTEAATDEAGEAVTVKSAAFVPPIVIVPIDKSAVPVFSMVNVFVSVDPVTDMALNSVSSEVLGVISPSVIVLELPVILISGAGV